MLLLLLLALVEAERSYTVGLFLRSPREKALATQARHVSDPKARSSKYQAKKIKEDEGRRSALKCI